MKRENGPAEKQISIQRNVEIEDDDVQMKIPFKIFSRLMYSENDPGHATHLRIC